MKNPSRLFRSRARLSSLLLVGLFCLAGNFISLGASTLAQAQTAADTRTNLEPLVITTSSGDHAFSVEVMRTDAEREKGLMFRRFMPADRGMLFDFKTEEPVMMWMKNTYLPLDMVFISRTGVVVNIAANMEPLSERIIPSGAPVYSVLELNAGTAARINLRNGDRIQNSLFKN